MLLMIYTMARTVIHICFKRHKWLMITLIVLSAILAVYSFLPQQPVSKVLLETKEPYTKTVACTKAGMCFTCLYSLGIDGKMSNDCGLKYSPACPGTRRALYHDRVYTLYYNGDKDPEISTQAELIHYETSCQ